MGVTLVVETGSGLSNANSFLSLSELDTYWAQRSAPGGGPNQIWFPQPSPSQPDPAIETKKGCLIRATAFIDSYWRNSWKGVRKSPDQALTWPRVGAYLDESDDVAVWPGFYFGGYALIADNVIPPQLKFATAELAQRCASLGNFEYPGDLAPDITTDQYVTSEKVGPIEVTYSEKRPQSTLYRTVNIFLKPLLRGSSSGIPLARG